MARSQTTYGMSADGSAMTYVRVGTELANAIPLQMDKMLPLLNPNVAPFMLLMEQADKREVGDMTYYAEDDAIVPEWSRLNGATSAITAGASNVGSWIVDDSAMFAPWDILKNMNTGSVGMVVTSDPSSDTLSMSAIAGAVLAGNDNDVIRRLGNAMDEGAGVPASRSVIPSRYTNYTQLTMRPIRFSREAMNAADYHGNAGAHYMRTHKKELLGMARDMEWAALFNPGPYLAAPKTTIVMPADQTTNVGITMGFDYFLQTYAPTENVVEEAQLTKSEFFKWLKNCSRYTESIPWIFGSGEMFAAMSDWGMGQVRFEPSKKQQTMGLNVGSTTLPTGGAGATRLVKHPLLHGVDEDDWNYIFYVDFSDQAIKRVFYHGMDMNVEKDVIDNTKVWGQKLDVVSCRWGTQFTLAERMGRLRFKTWSA